MTSKRDFSLAAAIRGDVGSASAEALSMAPSAGAALPVTEKRLEQLGSEVRSLDAQAQRMTLYYAIEVGRRLSEAKIKAGHGGWMDWLKRETTYSQSKANRLMKVFEEYGPRQIGLFGFEANSSTLTNLEISKAIALLPVPEDEREIFAQAVDAEHVSVRELEQLVRERDEARKEAEAARSEARTAEEIRVKMESDMALLKEQNELDRETSEKLRERVKELENAPKDVFQDEEAIKKAADAARAAAEAEWSAKVKEIEAKLAKAEEKAKKAAEKAKFSENESKLAEKAVEKRVSDEIAAAKAEADRLRAELATAKREQTKASISGDAELAAFQLLFEQVQTDVNKMRGLLLKVRGREDSDLGEKLATALLALADAVKESAA